MKPEDKYLVTGSTGFIGANLVRALLKKGAKVSVLVRKNSHMWRLADILKDIDICYGDINDARQTSAAIGKIKPTIVYHLATYGAYSKQDDADKIIWTNIIGTWNLLKACNEVGYRLFVNVGSSSEYGFKKEAMSEKDLLEPNSYYSVTKATQTHMCQYLAKQENLPIVTLRPFSIFGPYEDADRLIPTLMVGYANKKTLNMVSKKVARDFLYVYDFVNACLQINKLIKNKGEIFNIGSGKQTTMEKVISIFDNLFSEKGSVVWGGMNNRKWDSNIWKADIKKAETQLKWKPKYTLEEGLKETKMWFEKNSRLYNK